LTVLLLRPCIVNSLRGAKDLKGEGPEDDRNLKAKEGKIMVEMKVMTMKIMKMKTKKLKKKHLN
jgi:hypothetical protein